MNRIEIKNSICKELVKLIGLEFNKIAVLINDKVKIDFGYQHDSFQTTQSIEIAIEIPEDFDDVKLLANYNNIVEQNFNRIRSNIGWSVHSNIIRLSQPEEDTKDEKNEDDLFDPTITKSKLIKRRK